MLLLLYTVQAADVDAGLPELAYRFYNNNARWRGLYQLNRAIIGSDPMVLRAGQQLIIPVGTTSTPNASRKGPRYRYATPPIDPFDPVVTLLLYNVQPDDTSGSLPGLARRLYGDAARWSDLYKLNQAIIGAKPSQLEIGQQLIVPVRFAAGEQLAVRVHTVQHDDLVEGLLGLAQTLYGDAARWSAIYAVNRGTIGVIPLQLSPGQQLIIPS